MLQVSIKVGDQPEEIKVFPDTKTGNADLEKYLLLRRRMHMLGNGFNADTYLQKKGCSLDKMSRGRDAGMAKAKENLLISGKNKTLIPISVQINHI